MRDNSKVRLIITLPNTLVLIMGITCLILFLRLENLQSGTMRTFLIFMMSASLIIFILLHFLYLMLSTKNGIIERLDSALMKSLKDNENLEEKKGDLEIQLRHTQKLESIGTLAGGMAHDFNNLLSPILGYSDLALSRLSKDDTLYLYINEIVRAAAKAKDQVEQVLHFSRQAEENQNHNDITSIIEETVTVLRPMIPSTVDINLDLMKGELYAKADSAAINQIIVNLCTNGWQAMEESGGHLKITTALNTKTENIMLSVSDTGIGLDSETKSHMFEPFYSTRSDKSSSGLGLSVVQGIVSSCGGKIDVESTPGLGTNFTVHLPQRKKEEPCAGCKEKMEAGGHILLVDDDQNITALICNMLSDFGFTIEQFNESTEALETFRNQPDRFNLVITDLTMPRLTGSELKKEILKIRDDIPVLIMTGYGKNEPEDETKILKKPFVKNELLTAIEQILQNQ